MPPVKIVTDQNELVPCSKYPYAKFPYDKFNPVQSRVFEFYEQDANAIIVTTTSSGKTVCGEMFLAHEIRKRGGKGMFLAPYKSLSQEKIRDWTRENYHFSDLKICICTGDYKLTAKREKELNEADLIIMTTELLNHRTRSFFSERNTFLQEIGTLVVDEIHSLGMTGRGDKIECGLMRFTEINKKARIVGLSATIPNSDQIAEWVSYILTGKETYLVKSTYRPCPLIMHYEKYWDGDKSYDATEEQKMETALQIVNYYPEDKFLIFAHTKKTGELMKKKLIACGIDADFHKADLAAAKKHALEDKFREDKSFRVLVATSTLAAGVNLPARRVIILGVHRGLEEVDDYDLRQQCGRAGRPAYDPVGDAYILLPESKFDEWKEILKNPKPIMSKMLHEVNKKYKVLAFHLNSEIYQENVKTIEDIHKWYERSLARFQSKSLSDIIVDQTLESLQKCSATKEDQAIYTANIVGKIASLFYFSPFDVADLKRNFTKLFDSGQEDNDYCLSFALGNIDTLKDGIASRADKEAMSKYAYKLNELYMGDNLYEPAIKAGYAYYLLLTGTMAPGYEALCTNLKMDFLRTNQVLLTLDGFMKKWHKQSWFRTLALRINYGVKGHMADLCQLPNIGGVRANKLYNAGIKTVKDVMSNKDQVRQILRLKGDTLQALFDSCEQIISKELMG